jgi:hypothetical protein
MTEFCNDICDRISKKFPSEIDVFAKDHERRSALTDKSIEAMLSKILFNIDYSKLDKIGHETYFALRSAIR